MLRARSEDDVDGVSLFSKVLFIGAVVEMTWLVSLTLLLADNDGVDDDGGGIALLTRFASFWLMYWQIQRIEKEKKHEKIDLS